MTRIEDRFIDIAGDFAKLPSMDGDRTLATVSAILALTEQVGRCADEIERVADVLELCSVQQDGIGAILTSEAWPTVETMRGMLKARGLTIVPIAEAEPSKPPAGYHCCRECGVLISSKQWEETSGLCALHGGDRLTAGTLLAAIKAHGLAGCAAVTIWNEFGGDGERVKELVQQLQADNLVDVSVDGCWYQYRQDAPPVPYPQGALTCKQDGTPTKETIDRLQRVLNAKPQTTENIAATVGASAAEVSMALMRMAHLGLAKDVARGWVEAIPFDQKA